MGQHYYPVVSGPAKRHGAMIPPALESGDAMMATWPSPEATREVRQQACEAALDIIDAVAGFNRTHRDTPLPTRVGVHLGDMTLEWMGVFFSPTGADVNATQRIEALNKVLGTRVLVSQPVLDELDMYLYRHVGTFRLSGLRRPIAVCELICRMADADAVRKESVTAWAGALAVYRSRRWDEAIAFFEAFERAYGKDGPCRFYIERCRQYKTNPPPESWDGLVQINK
jgi:adenylate cyclase